MLPCAVLGCSILVGQSVHSMLAGHSGASSPVSQVTSASSTPSVSASRIHQAGCVPFADKSVAKNRSWVRERCATVPCTRSWGCCGLAPCQRDIARSEIWRDGVIRDCADFPEQFAGSAGGESSQIPCNVPTYACICTYAICSGSNFGATAAIAQLSLSPRVCIPAMQLRHLQWGDKSIDPNPAYATRSCRVAFSSHTHLFCRLSGQAHN